MKKLAIVFAVGAAALLGGSAANAADNTVKAKAAPEIQNATRAVTESDAFETVVTKAITAANHALLDNGNDNTIMQLQNLGSLVRSQLQESNPKLAARIPDDLDAQIADLGRSHGLTNVLQAIEKIEFLGLILPPIALALLIASILAGADRMAALMRLGIGLMIWGAGSFVVLLLAKPYRKGDLARMVREVLASQ